MEENKTPESGQQPRAKRNRKEFQGSFKNFEPIQRAASLMSDEIYLAERLEDQMKWYDRKSSHNQKMYKQFKRVEFYIAATIPVIISLSNMGVIEQMTIFVLGDGASAVRFTMGTFMQIAAAIGGVALVIINKVLELEEYHKNWKEYRSTCEALQHERVMYLTKTEPYDEEDAFPRLVEKVEAILNNETQKWKQVVKLEPKKKEDETKARARAQQAV